MGNVKFEKPAAGLIRVLAIGDIIGRPGRQIIKQKLKRLRGLTSPDLVVANIENASGGFGIHEDGYHEILKAGVDYMTSGNHHYDQRGDKLWMDYADRMVRPMNFPPGSAGKTIIEIVGICEKPIWLVNLMGRTFMKPYDCPFRAIQSLMDKAKGQAVILLDFHAETTSEKMAMGHFVTGQVSAMWGTHTHVPTADARIIGKYTGYITDLGMTGPYDSVIGMATETVLPAFLTLERTRFEVAKADVRIGACLFDIHRETGQCAAIKPLFLDQDFWDEEN